MKLMYSIIIVIIACLLVFFVMKRSKPDVSLFPDNQSVTNSQNSDMNNQDTAETTPEANSNILMTVTKEGSGDEVAKNGDTVVVNYTGYLADGTKFDSSLDHGSPFSFTLGAGQVIAGWDIGVAGMKLGESRRLVIPPAYAYGEAGYPGAIPPNATLTFDVELIDINPTTASTTISTTIVE
jgi:FKBP-type peptidyl-prolyl cis-trans isomerase